MIRSAVPLALLAFLLLRLAAPAAAQTRPGGTPLDALHDRFQQRRLALVEEGKGYEAIRALTAEFTRELQTFVEEKATGLDRFNGRLMLADYLASIGERDRAIEALKGLDAEQAPALALVGAAELAGLFGLDAERTRWIDAAIGKPTSFEDRMALGMYLMTRLGEIEKGEKIFDDAFDAAKDDEERARVSWYAADTLRHREDLSEDKYEEALKLLAESYPQTYWGSVAADRLRARALQVGAEAIPLTLKDTSGKTVTLADYEGKVLLLDFWASWCGPCREARPALLALQEKYADRGFAILGIAMDDDAAAAKRVIEQQKIPWRQVVEGKKLPEAALRYAVDAPPRMFLIGKDGKIAALHIYPFDESSLEAMTTAIEAALAK